MIDWSGAVLSLLKTLKKEDPGIAPKYLAIKPRLLSDHNQLRALAALRAVLGFIPSGQIASSILSLGDTGFKIWKAIALRKDYATLEFPPLGINTLIFLMRNDPVLNQHFGDLLKDGDAVKLQEINDDFSFITTPEILQSKYPSVPSDYVDKCCQRNLSLLGEALTAIEQQIKKVSKKPEVDANLQEALEALKNIFPSMRDWGLLNSQTFNEVLEIIDTIV